MNELKGYDEDYYKNYLGMDYTDKNAWEPFFRSVASRIAADFSPSTVLDVGCAFGYLVEYLRDLGIEAWGIDTSEYAIEHVSPNIKPYVRVCSATDSLPDDMPQRYDMVTNIEVLEHIVAEEAMLAMSRYCGYSDRVLFSSSAEDIENPTHVNVHQPQYWAQCFAQYGFFKCVYYDASYLSLYAFVFERVPVASVALVERYEAVWESTKQNWRNEQRTSSKLLRDITMIRDQKQTDEEYFRNEIVRLTGEVQAGNQAIVSINDDLVSRNQAVVGLNSDLEKCNQTIADLNDDLESHNRTIEKLVQDAGSLQQTYANEKNELLEKASELQNQNNAYQQRLLAAESSYISLQQSTAYKIALRLAVVTDCLFPYDTRRRTALKGLLRFAKKVYHTFQKTFSTKDVPVTPDASPIPCSLNSFYTKEELQRQEYCRNTPIHCDVKFSIVVPVFNTPVNVLQSMIFSVKDQIYPNWELCIVDASSEKADNRNLIEQLNLDCGKIKYKALKDNYGISGNTTCAFEMTTGDFVALLDHDDMIPPNALYEYASWLQEHPEVDFFYSDKDMINEEGTCRLNPFFKPEYSPEIMYSANYFTHFCAVRKSVLESTEGFGKNTDGAQDWDLFFKIINRTEKIKRIDKILYHWRMISTSVACGVEAKPYVLDAQLVALNGYIRQRGWQGNVRFASREQSLLHVQWEFKEAPTTAVIILSNDGKKEVHLSDANKIVLLKKSNLDIDKIVNQMDEDVVLFIDGEECGKVSPNLIKELSPWAMHPEIGFVAPQLRQNSMIKSCGLVYVEGKAFDMFANKPVGFYGQMGGSEWYRNFYLFRGTCVAIERKKYVDYCAYKPNYNSLSITHNCARIQQAGLRNVYDHFSYAEAAELLPIEKLNEDFSKMMVDYNLPSEDPYFNNNCAIDIERIMPVQATPQEASAATLPLLDKYSSDAMILAGIYDFTCEDLEENAKVINNNYHGPVKSMVWFLPEFDYVFYAGLFTIFRTIDFLRKEHGMEHTLVFASGLNPKIMLQRVVAGFPGLEKCKAYCIAIDNDNDLKQLKSYDASVCTFWTTAYTSMKFNRVKRKFYFIQDYEPLFYPGGSTYAQTEASYRFGFMGIANTQGLRDVYSKEFGGLAVSLDPSVDTKIFYPNSKRDYNKKPYTLFFYGRPGHPRNGFELGVQALKRLKTMMGNQIRIVTAGAEYDTKAYGIDGIVENLGRLKIEQTGELYRTCDAGLVMMYTRHPSYLPYEMMACGCCVVSNYNAYTSWFLHDGVNSVVCESSASSIAQAIEEILKDGDRRKKISEQGAQQISKQNPDWNTSLERVAEFIFEPEKFRQ